MVVERAGQKPPAQALILVRRSVSVDHSIQPELGPSLSQQEGEWQSLRLSRNATDQIRDDRHAVTLGIGAATPLRNHGGSCDAPSRLSSSSTTAAPTSARPKHGRAERKRCGGGSGCPVTPSVTPRSRLFPPNRATRSPSASFSGTRRCSNADRPRPSHLRPGGSVGSKRRENEQE